MFVGFLSESLTEGSAKQRCDSEYGVVSRNRKEENKAMSDADRVDYNRQVIEQFRANGGKVEGWAPLILLTTRGAKSGQERIYPLMAVPYENTYLAVASKGGAPKNPLWYNNVMAHPDVTVEVGNETFAANARLLHGTEKFLSSCSNGVPTHNAYRDLSLYFCLKGTRLSSTYREDKGTKGAFLRMLLRVFDEIDCVVSNEATNCTTGIDGENYLAIRT